MNDSSNNLEQCTWDLQKIQDEDERDNTNIEATALLSTIGAASNTCLEIFDAATQQHTEITPAVQQNSTNKPAFFYANDSLKPKELSMGFTPAQFCNWQAQFMPYSSHMADLSIPDQQAYIFASIDDTIRGHILSHINDQTPLLGNNGCMPLIQEEFLRAYLLIKRRTAFFQCKQESNQNLADHIANLNTLWEEADLQNLLMDDLYMLQLMVGLKDDRITKELIHQRNLSKDQFFNYALDISASYNTAKNIKENKLVQAQAISVPQ